MIQLLIMKNALDGSLKWREVCFSIPWIWFVYMVFFSLKNKMICMHTNIYHWSWIWLNICGPWWRHQFYWNKRAFGNMFVYCVLVSECGLFITTLCLGVVWWPLESHKELCKNITMFVEWHKKIHKAQAILEKLEERR